jgi:hypothetical protein
MPRITNPRGTAIINRGFIILLLQAFYSLWILEEGSDPGIRSFVEPKREVNATGGYVDVDGPSTSCAPLQLSPLV